MTASADEPFRVVFVCTGNICRSPMADVVFRWFADAAGLRIASPRRSAGTGDWHVGERADQRTLEALERRGYDGARHRARQFTHADFADNDLVVALDRTHERILHGWARSEGDADKIALLLSFDPNAHDARRARPLLRRPRNVRRGARYDREREPVAVPTARTRAPPRRPDTERPDQEPVSTLPPQPLSPLDGRYRAAVAGLADYLSEAGLNRARVEVEVEWLIALTDRSLFETSPLSDADKERLRALYRDFGQAEIDWLAEKEAVTRHDVKAIEYLVRDRLSTLGLDAIAELTHFACTSEDINSASYALTVQARGRRGLAAEAARRDRDAARARRSSTRTPRCSRARTDSPRRPRPWARRSPCSRGVSSASRAQIAASEYLAKFSGATGTWSAHVAAGPDADWPALIARRSSRASASASTCSRRRSSRTTGRSSSTTACVTPAASCTTSRPTSGPTSRSATSRRSRSPVRPARRRCRTRSTRSASRTPRRTSRSRAPCSARCRRRSSPPACSATSPTRRRSATSASRSATRCSRSTTCAAA